MEPIRSTCAKCAIGVSVAEGTLPISLSELHENTRRSGRSALSLEQLLAQLREGDARQQSASRTEINRRLSLPFSCVAFALVAVPLGVTTQRRETSVGFGVSIAVAFSDFLFMIVADTLRENPRAHPELLVWFPNLLFLALGAAMFRRLLRR
jgi:lipopolysaccharide export system permease protein